MPIFALSWLLSISHDGGKMIVFRENVLSVRACAHSPQSRVWVGAGAHYMENAGELWTTSNKAYRDVVEGEQNQVVYVGMTWLFCVRIDRTKSAKR